MARIRSIHPEACESLKLAAVSGDAERLFWRLQTHCDDEGRIEDDPRVIGAKCVPMLGWPADFVDALLGELATVEGTPGTEPGLIVRYVAGGRHLIAVRRFRGWPAKDYPAGFQRPKWPQQSRHPAMSDACPTYERRLSDACPTDVPTREVELREVELSGVDPSTSARVLQEACEIVGARRRLSERAEAKDDPAAWLAAARSGIRSELLGVGVHDDPEAWADAVEPERPAAPARPDPTADASAAQRKRAERDMRVARGEPACSACFDVGYTEQPDGTMARCRECNP